MVETRWRVGMVALIAASVGLFGCNDLTGVDDAETDDEENEALAAPPKPAPVASFSCSYPSAGSMGVAQGQFVPQSIQLSNGFLPGSDVASTFAFAETYDCDGSKGYHAIAVDTSQYG